MCLRVIKNLINIEWLRLYINIKICEKAKSQNNGVRVWEVGQSSSNLSYILDSFSLFSFYQSSNSFQACLAGNNQNVSESELMPNLLGIKDGRTVAKWISEVLHHADNKDNIHKRTNKINVLQQQHKLQKRLTISKSKICREKNTKKKRIVLYTLSSSEGGSYLLYPFHGKTFDFLTVQMFFLYLRYNNIQYFMKGLHLFNSFLKSISELPTLYARLGVLEDAYNLRKYHISDIFPKSAAKIFANIQNKFYPNYAVGQSSVWFENELRLFVWTILCYSQLHKIQIRQFTRQNWTFFENIFYVKQPILFEYQALIVFDYSSCLRRWSQQQDLMLTKILSGVLKIKWNEIAKSLFFLSQKRYIRTSKQCRERWLNHLDPMKIKQSWSLAECKMLLESVLSKGKKWATLAENLNKRRSQHSIKNKYNSMLSKQSKLFPLNSEEQNCRILLQQMESFLSSTNLALPKIDSLIFQDFINKQNICSEQQQLNILQKSNATLDRSLSLEKTQQGEDQNMNEVKFEELLLEDLLVHFPARACSTIIEKPEKQNKTPVFEIRHKTTKRRSRAQQGNSSSSEVSQQLDKGTKKSRGRKKKDLMEEKDELPFSEENLIPCIVYEDQLSSLSFVDIPLTIRQSQLEK